MPKLLLLLCCLFLTTTLSAQAIAQKLPDHRKQETESQCGAMSFWVKGHWQWDDQKQNYLWVEGHCESYRKGYTYLPGRWIRVEEGWIWQEGQWKKI